MDCHLKKESSKASSEEAGPEIKEKDEMPIKDICDFFFTTDQIDFYKLCLKQGWKHFRFQTLMLVENLHSKTLIYF